MAEEEADAAPAAAEEELDDDDDDLPVVVMLGAEVVLAGDETGVALALQYRVMSYVSNVRFGQYLVWQL